MNYIKSEDQKKKLLKVCKYLDSKNEHMLGMAIFLSQLSKQGIILSEKDSDYFQEKFMLPNGKIAYENAINDLSASLPSSKISASIELNEINDSSNENHKYNTIAPQDEEGKHDY